MEQPLRPTFLTVLCMLTFLASAYGIYSGITSYTTADTFSGVVQSGFDKAKKELNTAETKSVAGIFNSISDAMDSEKIKKNALGSLLSSILCAIGAFFMWNLQKKGFWIYVLGTVVGIVVPLVVFGGGLMGLAASASSAFFGVLFCILYVVNLKHLA